MQDNPYAKYTQPTAPQAPAQTAPAFIPGTISPAKRAAEQRAQEDQQFQREDRVYKAEDQSMQRENQEIARRRLELTEREAAVKLEEKESGFNATEGERKAGAFLIRALGANGSFKKSGVGPRSYVGQAMANNTPDLLNVLPGFVGNSQQRQVADSAQDEFIAASLRQDSGAAIPAEELEKQRRIYFPMPGDGPDVIKQKEEARERAIAGLRQSAGRLLEPTLAEWERMQAETGGSEENKENPLSGYYDKDGNPLPADWEGGEIYDKDGNYEGFGGFSVTDETPNQPVDGEGGYSLSGIGNALGAGLGDIVGGFGDIAGIVGNPLNATINSVFGTNLSTDLGSVAKAATGLPEGNQTVSTINRAATGALTFGGLARGAGILATSPLAQGVLGTIGRTPIRDTVAGAGAGAGMVAGNEIGGPVGGVLGTVAGGLAGYKGANTAVNAFTKSAPTELANIAARQKVDLLPADVGGPAVKGITTGTKASPLSVGPVVKQAGASQNQMRQAVNRVTGRQGEVIDTDAAGESIRAAGKRFTKETSQRGSRLYEKAGELAKGVTIKPRTTIAALDGQIAEVKANPAAPPALLKELETFKANIEGGVSVLGLRNARTTLSQGVYDGKLRSGPEKALYKQILGNLSDDIQAGLHNAGRGEAADAFKRADTFWKARVEHIDEVLQPILGKDGMKGGEDVVMAVESMARGKNGGNARLSRLLGAMSPEEAGNARAVLIDRIGRATPGKQSAEGAEFSPSTFLTNWNRMTPQGKASLFAEPQLRRDLTDIATLAEKMKATEAMANHSNTGMAVGGNAVLGTILGYTNPLALGAGASVQYSIGKLMASPRFARMLARTTELPERVQGRKFIEQLGVLAAREPAIAADARGLQQHLQQTIGQSPATNLAAEEQN